MNAFVSIANALLVEFNLFVVIMLSHSLSYLISKRNGFESINFSCGALLSKDCCIIEVISAYINYSISILDELFYQIRFRLID